MGRQKHSTLPAVRQCWRSQHNGRTSQGVATTQNQQTGTAKAKSSHASLPRNQEHKLPSCRRPSGASCAMRREPYQMFRPPKHYILTPSEGLRPLLTRRRKLLWTKQLPTPETPVRPSFIKTFSLIKNVYRICIQEMNWSLDRNYLNQQETPCNLQITDFNSFFAWVTIFIPQQNTKLHEFLWCMFLRYHRNLLIFRNLLCS